MNSSKLSPGKNPPEEINVVVEIPQGSFIKYEMDESSGFILVDRFSYTSMAFPGNYGFIPQSHGEDGDPLDVLLVATYAVQSGSVVPSRVIGMLEMEDEEGVDTKIIAVPTKKVDPFFSHVEDVADLSETLKKKIQHYFNHYKELEPGKWVKTKKFLGRDEAYKAIINALK